MTNFKKHFWQVGLISLPLTLATASSTLLILIDSFFATRISIESYEAVYLTLPILGLATGIGIGLSAAIADLVSKEKELTHIKRLIMASLVLTLVSIAIFLYIALFQQSWIEQLAGLHHLEADSLIAKEFRTYWNVILWTFPMQILFSLTVQLLTILEMQKTGMFIILVNLLMNLVLDYWFTQVLDWGVEGLAYSTMGVFSMGLLLSVVFLRGESYFKLPYPTLFSQRFLEALGKLTSTTLMIFMSVVVFSVTAIILNQIALGISTSALVVFAIYSQIMRVIIITTRGLAGGFIIYIGKAFRDKNTKEYYPIYWASTAWVAIFNLGGAILMILIPEQLINLFDNVDQRLYTDIVFFLGCGAFIMFVYILPRLAVIAFISLNKSILLVMNSLVFVCIQIFGAYYFCENYGVRGLIYAEITAILLTNAVFLPLFFYHMNMAKKRDASVPNQHIKQHW